MKSPICLITGATEGVGKVTALELAKKGFTVVAAARDANKAVALMNEIETSTGQASCAFIVADLGSLRQAPGAHRLVSYLSLPFSISPVRGARTSVYLASSPEVRGISGQYFARSKMAAVRNRFDTAENRALLWDLSVHAAEEGGATAARRAG